MKKFNKNSVNRRDFIRNTAGITASASMANMFVQKALADDADAKKMILWYVPEGAAQQAFWPMQTGPIVINDGATINGKHPRSFATSIRGYIDEKGADMGSYCLQPLQNYKQDFSLYSGFQNRGPAQNDPHAKVVQSALTGGAPREGSFDQVLGPLLKREATLDSIYFPVYGHHVNNRGPDNYMSPARRVGGGTFGVPNWNPVQVLQQVFPSGIPAPSGGGTTGPADYSEVNARLAILKSVEARLEEVKCIGGDQARRKLEVLLQTYQKLAQDTQSLVNAQSSSTTSDVRFDLPNGWENTTGARNDKSKYWTKQSSFGKFIDITIDTTVAALALDRTHVSLMQLSASGDTKGPAEAQHYSTLGIQGLEAVPDAQGNGGDCADHQLGHNDTARRRRDQARIFRWYYSKLAELIDKLKAVPYGNGTLFDNTIIVTCSEFGMFNHRDNDIPYIVAGGSNIDIRKGQYQDVATGNTSFRHSADLWLGVAQALGTNLTKFGQSGSAFKL